MLQLCASLLAEKSVFVLAHMCDMVPAQVGATHVGSKLSAALVAGWKCAHQQRRLVAIVGNRAAREAGYLAFRLVVVGGRAHRLIWAGPSR